MDKKNILIFLFFFFIAQNLKIATAEWVEIPQFSDEKKVYRGPFGKFEGNPNLHFGFTETPPEFHGHFSNVTEVIHGFNKIQINQHPGFSQTWTNKPTEAYNDLDFPQFGATQETIYFPGNGVVSSTFPTTTNMENFPEDNNFETVTEEKDEQEDEATTHANDRFTVDENQQQSENKPNGSAPESEEDDDSNRSFLYFIPIALFKRVHATLKAQPATMKGKMHFLKNFEKALLAEIHKRLLPVVAPVRKRRDSRGDHGWDDHEDSVGFPSLEGALMAISFLTFAVYLVRIVMMLFRNLQPTPTPATGTATVLFNRNRRSADELNEQTATVLEYLDKYAKTRHRNY